VDRRRDRGSPAPYPRTARVNALLREVIADELELLCDVDDRLSMITVTAVVSDPDFRHARVLLASLPAPASEALAQHRVRLQAAVAAQARLRRTPTLEFAADPVVAAGERVEEVLRQHRRDS
jgi:ribosome-binding factor A